MQHLFDVPLALGAEVIQHNLSRTARRPHHVYIRRRIAVASVLFSLVAALGLGAGNVLANRGGAPASTAAVRHEVSAATYLVQPGDTMFSIAEMHRGDAELMAFVDALIARNGGTSLQIGQLVSLP